MGTAPRCNTAALSRQSVASSFLVSNMPEDGNATLIQSAGPDKLPSASDPFTCINSGVSEQLLAQVFPQIVQTFEPHLVQYSNTNPLIAEADGKHGDDIQWKVSSYMDLDRANEGAKQKEVNVNLPLRDASLPLLERCDELFVPWFEQLHGEGSVQCLCRMQSFVTRYRARPNENALLRHIDGALVDGSVILALPTEVPYEGGGVTVWHGEPEQPHMFPMEAGDVCLLDNFVWHQGNPITSGERWALVIFYSVRKTEGARLGRVLNRFVKHLPKKPADPEEIAARQAKVRASIMQIIPLYATSQFVAVADLQPSDVVMELGFAGGEVLLEVLRHQVQSCIAVDLGEGTTDTMMARLSGDQQVDEIQIRQIELSCLVQELDLTGVTVLLVHFNKSWSGIIATLLEGVKHEMRVVTYAEPLRPTDEWTAASKVIVTCENPQTLQEKYARSSVYSYQLPRDA